MDGCCQTGFANIGETIWRRKARSRTEGKAFVEGALADSYGRTNGPFSKNLEKEVIYLGFLNLPSLV